MARLKNKKTASKRYWLNALLLILPVVFIYQSFNPEFPASLPETQAGDFTLTAMPYDEDKPYQHDGLYVKDFLVMFQDGGVDEIRQGQLKKHSSTNSVFYMAHDTDSMCTVWLRNASLPARKFG